MNYSNTFRFLNPHLHTTKADSIHDIKNIYSVKRSPPIILRCSDIIRATLQRNHTFDSVLFDKAHEVYYPRHIVKTVKRNPTGFFRIINAYTLWGNGYYHFLTEVLPSVLFIGKPYTIHCLASSFASSVFQWFGITNTVKMSPPDWSNIKESVEQPYIECGNPSPEKITLLRKPICEKLTFTKTLGIVIYRSESVRKILNHDAVVSMLQTVYPQFEWVTFDRLSIAETATLFSKAGMIVAPHGAGLTNMIFSASGIPILEFMPLEKPNLCYWHLSELLGNHYTMIPLETEAGNFRVDIEMVKGLLPVCH